MVRLVLEDVTDYKNSQRTSAIDISPYVRLVSVCARMSAIS